MQEVYINVHPIIDEVTVIFRKFECVVKIYIIRPKPGPVAKNATPSPSGWVSNPLLWIARPVLHH